MFCKPQISIYSSFPNAQNPRVSGCSFLHAYHTRIDRQGIELSDEKLISERRKEVAVNRLDDGLTHIATVEVRGGRKPLISGSAFH